MPCLLHPPQHHDLHQAADMERGGGRIETDIARYDLLLRQRVETRRIGDVMDIAARVEQAQEVGLIVAHGARL